MRNSADIGGGGVAFMSINNNTIKVTLIDCLFEKNRGGSVHSENTDLTVFRTKFIDNYSQHGGSFFTRGIFRSNISEGMIDLTTNTEIIDSNFTYTYGVDTDIKTFTAFLFSGKYLTGSSQFEVKCPDNHDMSKTIIYRTISKGIHEILETDINNIMYLDIKCTPCGNGKYTINRSFFTSKNASKEYHMSCQKCPSGGSCNTGLIKSLPLFWGYVRNSGKNITFLPCPNGQCLRKATSYDSCEPNRSGRLCSKCRTNHSLGFFSSGCIANEKCNKISLYFIITTIILIGCVATAVCMHLAEIKKRFSLLWSDRNNKLNCSTSKTGTNIENSENLEGAKTLDVEYENCTKKEYALISTKSSETVELATDGKDGNADNNGDDSSGSMITNKRLKNIIDKDKIHDTKVAEVDEQKSPMFAKILMVITFFQTQYFFKVPSNENSGVMDQIENILFSIASFDFFRNEDSNTSTSIANNVCIINFTNVHKRLLTLFVCLCPIVISALIYTVARVLMKKELKLKAHKGATRLLMLTFIPIATNLFELVNCLTIHGDDGEINFLFIQADTVCPNWWQNIIYVVIAIWIVPMVLSMAIAADVLTDENEVDNGMLILLFPLSAMYFLYSFYKNDRNKKEVEDCEKGLQTDETNDDRFTKDRSVNEAGNESQVVDTIHDIRDMILGPCKLSYWPGVIHMRKLLVAVIFVWCNFIVLRLYGLILVLALYLVLLCYKKPYMDRLVLWIDTTITISLLMIGTLSLYDTQIIYHTAETDDSRQLYTTFQVLKFVVIIIQPFIFVALLMIDKYVPEKKVTVHQEKKAN